MTVFSPIKLSLLALMLAGATCLSAQTQTEPATQDKAAATQTSPQEQKAAPAEDKAVQQDANQPADESQKQTAVGAGNQTQKPEQAAEKTAEPSSDEQSTTPVTPQTKKPASDSATDSTKHAMSEAEALPQGTPFVSDLNLYGPTTAELRQKLTSALRNDPALNGSSVVATVTDDSISLTGSVRTAKDRITARRIAESFATNRKVTEKITVAGSAAANGINQSPATSESNPPKKQSTPPPTSTGQKPESPNRPTVDPANAQEKPKPGNE